MLQLNTCRITLFVCSNAGKIGDPYCELESLATYVVHSRAVCLDRFNDQEQVWVGLQNWTYSIQFDISDLIRYDKSVWLKCDGIDTVANIR